MLSFGAESSVCKVCYTKNLKIKRYRIIILPVVLYRCEILSIKLREERRHRVLRRIFGPKRDEVTGAWIKTS
jgi:hypothetical protein